MIPKDVYSLMAKTDTNIFTAEISWSGIMDDFYYFCILIFSNFSTMNVYFLCNKKIKVIKKEKKRKTKLLA